MRGVNKGILSSFPLTSEGHPFWRESKCQFEGVVLSLAVPLEIHLVVWPKNTRFFQLMDLQFFPLNRLPLNRIPCKPPLPPKNPARALKPGLFSRSTTNKNVYCIYSAYYNNNNKNKTEN